MGEGGFEIDNLGVERLDSGFEVPVVRRLGKAKRLARAFAGEGLDFGSLGVGNVRSLILPVCDGQEVLLQLSNAIESVLFLRLLAERNRLLLQDATLLLCQLTFERVDV